MQEVDSDLIGRANQSKGLLVDSREACIKEAGELINAGLRQDDLLEIGRILPMDHSGELDIQALKARLESGLQDSGPQIPDFKGPVTLFKSVGIGLQDVAIGAAVVLKAEELGIGYLIGDYDA
jgi:ornithine cyclodeaminase